MNNSRLLAVEGDVADINCWSNIPYYFFRAGKSAGFFSAGSSIDLQRLKWPRRLWNALAPFQGRRLGGFQFSRARNEYLSRQIDWNSVDEVISHSQRFPPFELMQERRITYSHYIDFPLQNYFEEYQNGHSVRPGIAREALAREREQYAGAKFVVCMSHWAARQVIERCQTPANKVRTIIPGANLPEELFENLVQEEVTSPPPDGKRVPLRIAFVGIDWKRKGLDRLVEAVRILRSRHFSVSVRVIGPKQNPYPGEAGVEYLGFVDKRQEPNRLVSELRACHIGALPSRHEAFGIAALEYLRCGMPALITNAGGLGDSIPPECGIILDKDCTGDVIASVLENLLKNPELYSLIRQCARANASYASWNRCIRDFQTLWATADREQPSLHAS